MKKLFSIIAIVAVAATAGWNFSQSQNEVKLNDLALENIDALANPEYPTIPGFNDKIVYKTWNTNYSPPRLQTVCYDNGTQYCA